MKNNKSVYRILNDRIKNSKPEGTATMKLMRSRIETVAASNKDKVGTGFWEVLSERIKPLQAILQTG